MGRGQAANDGDTRVAQNGYHYTKVKGEWRLTHHLIMEKKLERPIDYEKELVTFVDGNRHNLAPENIAIKEKGKSSLRRRLAQLEARRDEINAQIEQVEQALKAQASS